MANFVYNPERGNSNKQWYDFQQQKSFNDDLAGTFQAEARNISNAISASSEDIVGSLYSGFDSVNDALGEGFSDLSDKLGNINSSIENVALMLDWRLSEMIDQQKISNLLLGNMTLLLRVPDFQKERQYYIEQGFKHYKNSSIDPDLYEDALKNLLEAEKRETTDYIVLHRIGMIYLYSTNKKTQDLDKAEDYFRRAAKYAIAESNPAAQKTLNILAGMGRQELSTPEAAKRLAAGAYLQAGFACYAQRKFPEASEWAEKAYTTLPSLLEAGFLQAKSLAVVDKVNESTAILAELIGKQWFYAIKAASDEDLSPKNEVQQLLLDLRDKAVMDASERLSNIKSKISDGKNGARLLSKIEQLVEKNTLSGALSALDLLTEKKHKLQIDGLEKVLYEDFMQMNPDLKDTAEDDCKKIFDKVRKNRERDDVFLRSYSGAGLSIDELIIAEEQTVRFREEIRQMEIEQINHEIKWRQQSANEERWRIEKETKDAESRRQRTEQQKQIREFLTRAQDEENKENQKWIFRNYDLAIYFYEQAANLGSSEAKRKLSTLKK